MSDKETTTKKERITQNGIVRPAAGTKTGRVWEISDDLSQSTGAPATRADVLAQCKEEGINSATGATQYGRWCKFNGVPKPPRSSKKTEEAKETSVEEEDFPEE